MHFFGNAEIFNFQKIFKFLSLKFNDMKIKIMLQSLVHAR